jgi:ABC-type phosphate transport system permease subunit
MMEKLKTRSVVVCLFVFLFVVVGGGLHLNMGGALAAALSGTPLVIYAFNRWLEAQSRVAKAPREEPATEGVLREGS